MIIIGHRLNNEGAYIKYLAHIKFLVSHIPQVTRWQPELGRGNA